MYVSWSILIQKLAVWWSPSDGDDDDDGDGDGDDDDDGEDGDGDGDIWIRNPMLAVGRPHVLVTSEWEALDAFSIFQFSIIIKIAIFTQFTAFESANV